MARTTRGMTQEVSAPMQDEAYVKACEVCGTFYTKPPSCSVAHWPKRRYCSKACTDEARRLRVRATKLCGLCALEFERPRGISHVQWEARHFCSYDCARKADRMERPLCACGCGRQVVGPQHRWVYGHNYHVSPWRSCVDIHGRERWYVVARGRRFVWTRIVMEDQLGRSLLSTEVVHHINGDTTDDRPENLEVLTNSEHTRLHMRNGDYHQLTDAERRK